jgi:hypothetical protein
MRPGIPLTKASGFGRDSGRLTAVSGITELTSNRSSAEKHLRRFGRSCAAGAFVVLKQPMGEGGLSVFGKLPFIDMYADCA